MPLPTVPAWKHHLQSTQGHLVSPLGTGCGTAAPTVPAGSHLLVYCEKAEHRGCRGAFPALGQHTHAAWGRRAAASAVQLCAGTAVHTVPGTALAPVAQHELVCESCPQGCKAAGATHLPAALLSPCLQVTLAMLWLAASESQPPGWRDHAVLQRQRVLVQPLLRLRRHTDRRQCPDGMNWVETARRCCPQCPAGERCPVRVARGSTPWHSRCLAPGGRAPCHPTVPAGTFLKEACVCDPCPAGTFRTQPNTFSECQACYECDQHGELAPHHTVPCYAVPCRAAHCLLSAAFQSVLSNCSATSNIACGCEPGRFRDCVDKPCTEFSCKKCQTCTGRLIQRPCEYCQLPHGMTCQLCHLWLCHPASFPPSPQAWRTRTHFVTATASLTSTERVMNAGHVTCKH